MPVIQSAIDEYQPQAVITVGLAWGRTAITVEKAGLNVRDYPIADNEGLLIQNQPIVPDGPDAYFSTLPIRAIVHELRENGVPAFISYTAGTYLCNQIMYGTLDYCKRNKLSIRSGHIHIPYMASQVASKQERTASWPFEFLLDAIRLSIRATILNQTDIELIVGEVG